MILLPNFVDWFFYLCFQGCPFMQYFSQEFHSFYKVLCLKFCSSHPTKNLRPTIEVSEKKRESGEQAWALEQILQTLTGEHNKTGVSSVQTRPSLPQLIAQCEIFCLVGEAIVFIVYILNSGEFFEKEINKLDLKSIQTYIS